jgi:hypothetical protein
MLISKKDWESNQRVIADLQSSFDRMEKQQIVLIGMCREVSDQLFNLVELIQKMPVKEEAPNDLIVDDDGMYNYQKYKAKRKARLAGEGDM